MSYLEGKRIAVNNIIKYSKTGKMNKLLIVLLILSIHSSAQNKINFPTPPASPVASFMQELGNTEITISYGRPFARGRKIFGGLVPYDSVWRTGAGESTQLVCNDEIILGDKLIPPGRYSFYTIPSPANWIIIFNTDTTIHGAFGYSQAKDLVRITVPSQQLTAFQEVFTIDISDIDNRGGGTLQLRWENTSVKIPVRSTADEKVCRQIEEIVLRQQNQTPDVLFQAAAYYYATSRDLSLAAEWVEKAEQTDGNNFSYPNLLQKIAGDLKQYQKAIAAAKRALVIAEKTKMSNQVTQLRKRIEELENRYSGRN